MDETEVEHGGEAFDVAAAAATASREQQTPHFWLHFRGLKDTGSGGDCRARRAGRPGKTLRRSILIHIIVRHKLAWTAEAVVVGPPPGTPTIVPRQVPCRLAAAAMAPGPDA